MRKKYVRTTLLRAPMRAGRWGRGKVYSKETINEQLGHVSLEKNTNSMTTLMADHNVCKSWS